MSASELDGIVWRTSSYSGGNGECVEVGWARTAGMAVRDSKDPNGGILTFDQADWRAFLTFAEPFTALPRQVGHGDR